MAIKKPLVIGSSGLPEELQSTDSLANAELLTRTNGNAGAIVKGTPVYASTASAVDKARANAIGTSTVLGLVANTTVATGASASIQTDGVFSFASTTEVDAVAGTTGGFSVGTFYFLDSSTAGNITSTAPSSNPNCVTNLGCAVSTTELNLRILPPVLRG